MEKTPQHLELILKYFDDFTPEQLRQFSALETLYNDWNSKINVISRKDIDGLYEKHVLHSLSIAAVGAFMPGTEIIDIGTGGGFPGIPLAIIFPEVQFHLVDSIGKKLKVVENIKSVLGLTNVTTQHTRVEHILNRKFDYAVSRAVAPLKDLWAWSKPLLRKNVSPEITGAALAPADQDVFAPGLICLKGGDLKEEFAGFNGHVAKTEIHGIFPEEFFREKFVLYVRR
ncbi:MAG: 16S rRNA (guanine(527)-N(7))-methyltransferase RsmG [Chitinophagaceae bacterium]